MSGVQEQKIGLNNDDAQGYKGAHFATFPEELVEPCILAGSRPGEHIAKQMSRKKILLPLIKPHTHRELAGALKTTRQMEIAVACRSENGYPHISAVARIKWRREALPLS